MLKKSEKDVVLALIKNRILEIRNVLTDPKNTSAKWGMLCDLENLVAAKVKIEAMETTEILK